MNTEGYSPIYLIIVLAVGIPLAYLKPYKTFLISTLAMIAQDSARFNATRSALLGPYLNLTDAFLLVALFAFLFDRLSRREPLGVPHIVILLVVVLGVATCQSFWKLGLTYETARACRWALEVPMAFFLAANLVISVDRAKMLIVTLLLGAVLAALQHFFFVWKAWHSMALSMETYRMSRTIAYNKGSHIAVAFLLTGMLWTMPVKIWKKALCLMTGALLLTSLIFNQTRSIWFAMVGSIPCLQVLLGRKVFTLNVVKFVFIVLLMLLGVRWICHRAMPGLDIFQVIANRMQLFTENHAGQQKTGGRAKALRLEMSSWLEGTWIFGRGLYFFQTMENTEDPTEYIAFGHLGYVTYLSQIGLVGLFVYGLYFPLRTFGDAKWLWCNGGSQVSRYIGLLGSASIIYLSIAFLMSSSFLGLGNFGPGVLYGGMWALVRGEKKELKDEADSEYVRTLESSDTKPEVAFVQNSETQA